MWACNMLMISVIHMALILFLICSLRFHLCYRLFLIFLGVPPVQCTSQQILTDYTRNYLGHSDLNYELGTNSVIDIYMGFGCIGVIIAFFLLGKLIRKLEASDNNVPVLCVYIVLMTSVIFFCRGSFFGVLRSVVWSWLICSLMLKWRKILID